MTILIIEDDVGCVSLMKRVMKPYAQEPILVAGDMQTARHLIRVVPKIDLVCLDLRLPDSTIMETIKEIPSMKQAHPETTVLVITGMGDIASDKALAAGADLFASKHDVLRSPAELLMSIWKALGKRWAGKYPYSQHISMLEAFVNEQAKQREGTTV